MKAVVLAGGQEFGQCPLSRQAPRALWPLVDKPIIEHVLRALHKAGISEMIISANGRTHDIADRIGTHREAVSRELSRLAGIGLLRRKAGNLHITDVTKLVELVNDAKGE